MLVRVDGCSAPNSLFMMTMTWTSSCSASLHLPWLWYVLARFPMLLRVDGCSAPSSLFIMSKIWTPSCSASFHLPWPWYVLARFPMLIRCYNFDRFRFYSRDRSQSVSDNAQAYVQGASWAREYQLEDIQYPQVWEWISQSSSIAINKVTWLKTS